MNQAEKIQETRCAVCGEITTFVQDAGNQWWCSDCCKDFSWFDKERETHLYTVRNYTSY
mgnify:CR=1 FL=1